MIATRAIHPFVWDDLFDLVEQVRVQQREYRKDLCPMRRRKVEALESRLDARLIGLRIMRGQASPLAKLVGAELAEAERLAVELGAEPAAAAAAEGGAA